MAVYFFIIRHAESEVNADPESRAIWTGRNTWSELTEPGKLQARDLGRSLRNVPFDRVFCSPTVRTQQTARYFWTGLGRCWPHLAVAMELAELDHGALEGKPKREGNCGAKRDFWRFVPEGGRESQEAVAVRAGNWLAATADALQGANAVRLAVITHENVMKSVLVHMLGFDNEQLYHMPFAPCGFFVLMREQNAWRLAREVLPSHARHLRLPDPHDNHKSAVTDRDVPS